MHLLERAHKAPNIADVRYFVRIDAFYGAYVNRGQSGAERGTMLYFRPASVFVAGLAALQGCISG